VSSIQCSHELDSFIRHARQHPCLFDVRISLVAACARLCVRCPSELSESLLEGAGARARPVLAPPTNKLVWEVMERVKSLPRCSLPLRHLPVVPTVSAPRSPQKPRRPVPRTVGTRLGEVWSNRLHPDDEHSGRHYHAKCQPSPNMPSPTSSTDNSNRARSDCAVKHKRLASAKRAFKR
jgi:hypothetical protein